MAIVVPISGLRPEHLDKELLLRGRVTRRFQGRGATGPVEAFQLQELSVRDHGTLPRTLECFVAEGIDPPFSGGYFEVRGKLTAERGQRTTVSRVVLASCRTTEIRREEAIMEELMKEATWFTAENLGNVGEFESASDLIDFLNRRANGEGFQLVRKHSLKEHHIMLRCHQHSHFNKMKELNEDCGFLIRICMSKDDGRWHITTYELEHNHFMDPSIYAHLVLDLKTKSLIESMFQSQVQIPEILAVIKCQTGLQLSSQQVRSLCKQSSKDRNASETEELRLMMEQDGGLFYSLEVREEDKICRIGCAAFTEQELENLRNYGDFVSIDPTFAPLTTDWSIIPVTVVGKSRELCSGGLIFASNLKAETFIWILQMLLEQLPTKDSLRTLCSDDDSGLGSAFAKIQESDARTLGISQELKNRVIDLKRVICYWHKMENFRNYMVRAKIDKQSRDLYESYFKLMAFTRSRTIHDWALNKLKTIHAISSYIQQLQDKLQNFCKSRMNSMFNCGFITSSGSESANNRLKSHMSGRALTLCEIRKLQTEITHQAAAFTRYVKGRKHRKVPASERGLRYSQGCRKEIHLRQVRTRGS